MPRDRALHILLALFALNVLALAVVGRSYLSAVPEGTTATGWLAAWLGFVSNSIMLSAAVMIVATPFVLLWPRRWVIAAVCPALFTLMNFFVYADTIVFALYHFHFNGMVLNLLTTSGADDTLTLGRATLLSAVLALVVIIAVQAVLAWLGTRERAAAIARRGRWWLLAAVVLVVVGDKACYVYGDLKNRVEFTRVRQLYPFYQTVTMKRFADKVITVERDEALTIRHGTTLNYPKAVALPDAPRKPNVIVIALEGARFDMLDPAVMPRLHEWSRDEIVCANHYSGGNCTRFGIFSMLYGLHGTYWHAFLSERRGPYLVQALKQLGYAFQVQSCTDLNYPEFRQTAFVDVPEAINDRWKCERVDRDREMTTKAVEFLKTARRPFFSFLFYDASHATYRYPPEHEVFKPVVGLDDVNYVEIARQVSVDGLRPLFNRYRNSLHYIDEQLGRIIDQLRESDLLDDTLVFITGDHGEEFGEMGFHGHNVNFDRYQAQSLMVAHIPGRPAQAITRLTSHVDIVPTIFTEIGVQSPLDAYCQGVPLTQETARSHVVCASWDTAAIIDGQATIVFGTESYKMHAEIFDAEYRPMSDSAMALKQRQPMLLDMLLRMGEFSR